MLFQIPVTNKFVLSKEVNDLNWNATECGIPNNVLVKGICDHRHATAEFALKSLHLTLVCAFQISLLPLHFCNINTVVPRLNLAGLQSAGKHKEPATVVQQNRLHYFTFFHKVLSVKVCRQSVVFGSSLSNSLLKLRRQLLVIRLMRNQTGLQVLWNTHSLKSIKRWHWYFKSTTSLLSVQVYCLLNGLAVPRLFASYFSEHSPQERKRLRCLHFHPDCQLVQTLLLLSKRTTKNQHVWFKNLASLCKHADMPTFIQNCKSIAPWPQRKKYLDWSNCRNILSQPSLSLHLSSLHRQFRTRAC